MRAIDFFCGAGGLTRGLLNAGIEVIAGIDIDARCQESYDTNNAPSYFVQGDISEVTRDDLVQLTDIENTEDLVFVGCAPCQPFSLQRKGAGRRLDATLLREFGRLVEDVLPGHVLIENVPGMARVRGNSTFRRFLSLLRDNGYSVSFGVLDAKHFGVPQTRRRLVLIASLHGESDLPCRQHGLGLEPFRTVREAIGHLPHLNAGEASDTILNHTAASITPLNLRRLRHTPPDGGGRRDWPEELQLDCHRNGYLGHTDVYGRLHWDMSAPTLTGRCNSISNGRYGHPEQDRAISLREAACLQSFPDDYEFFGSNKYIALQIGNAVPVALAGVLGLHLRALAGELPRAT